MKVVRDSSLVALALTIADLSPGETFEFIDESRSVQGPLLYVKPVSQQLGYQLNLEKTSHVFVTLDTGDLFVEHVNHDRKVRLMSAEVHVA